jgi:hypothetical protein
MTQTRGLPPRAGLASRHRERHSVAIVMSGLRLPSARFGDEPRRGLSVALGVAVLERKLRTSLDICSSSRRRCCHAVPTDAPRRIGCLWMAQTCERVPEQVAGSVPAHRPAMGLSLKARTPCFCNSSTYTMRSFAKFANAVDAIGTRSHNRHSMPGMDLRFFPENFSRVIARTRGTHELRR